MTHLNTSNAATSLSNAWHKVLRYSQTLCVSFTIALLAACESTANDCNFDQSKIGIGPLIGANAGCVVIIENKLLVIESRLQRVSIPGGEARHGESAACTAIRETKEETGLNVTPLGLLKKWSNGFYLFECQPIDNDVKTSITQLIEVKAIHWLTINDFDHYRWRFKEQKDWLRAHLLSPDQQQ